MSTKIYATIATILVCAILFIASRDVKEFDECNTTNPPLPLGLSYGMHKNDTIRLLDSIFKSGHSPTDEDGVLQFSEIHREDCEEFDIVTLMFVENRLVSAWYTKRMPEGVKTNKDAANRARLWQIEYAASMGTSGERSFKPNSEDITWVLTNGERRSFTVDFYDGEAVATQKYTCDSAVKALH